MLVEDLGSTNGVHLAGGRADRASLAPGASFVAGSTVLSCLRFTPREGDADALEVESLPQVVGTSLPMRRVMREVRRLAPVRAPVLFRGETGTGKDVLARAMHAIGPRHSRPFVPLNVATLPRDLAEAELFGHDRGAFTGAHAARPGAFTEAHGGTLFLDEIAELTPELQAKLLRILEDGEVRPLGSTVRRKVDVRVVSATWASLERRVAEGVFRQDLYQRLAVVVIDVPPLRERRTDIPALSARVLGDLESELGPKELAPGAVAKLAAYAWPGNVRELRNVLYRAALRNPGRIVRTEDIAESFAALSTARAGFGFAGAGPVDHRTARRQCQCCGQAARRTPLDISRLGRGGLVWHPRHRAKNVAPRVVRRAGELRVPSSRGAEPGRRGRW